MPSLFESEKSFFETVKRWRLLNPHDRILVAVSGGLDSMALLSLVLRLPHSLRPRFIGVAHFNHRLRGRQSDKEERFIERFCLKKKVDFYKGRAPRWKKRSNLEARARQLRYSFLKKKAKQLKVSKVFLAHHANDQSETFLMRWLQGAGLKGLAGMRLSRVEEGIQLIRPLLFVSRSALDAFVKGSKIPYREDPSNKDPKYLRNKIRQWLSALVEKNSGIIERTAHNSIFLQADEDFVEGQAADFFGKKVIQKKKIVQCRVSDYETLPSALRYRLLQRMARSLKEEGSALSGEAILKLDGLILDGSPQKSYFLSDGLFFQKKLPLFGFFMGEG